MKTFFITFAILLIVVIAVLWGGSIPTIDPQECTESRETVREFYAFHFGNDMDFSLDNLKLRERFLTPELFEKLNQSSGETDVFTPTAIQPPRAFRVGRCTVESPERTVFNVLVFWSGDGGNKQQPVTFTTVKQQDKWLIDNIEFK